MTEQYPWAWHPTGAALVGAQDGAEALGCQPLTWPVLFILVYPAGQALCIIPNGSTIEVDGGPVSDPRAHSWSRGPLGLQQPLFCYCNNKGVGSKFAYQALLTQEWGTGCF